MQKTEFVWCTTMDVDRRYMSISIQRNSCMNLQHRRCILNRYGMVLIQYLVELIKLKWGVECHVGLVWVRTVADGCGRQR